MYTTEKNLYICKLVFNMNEADADDVNTTLISAFHILIHNIVHSLIKILCWTIEDTNIILRSMYKDSDPNEGFAPKWKFVIHVI